MNNNGKTPKPADPPFPNFYAEFMETPEPGNPIIVTTPFQVFGATWLGEVDGKTWTLADACRLMGELAGERGDGDA